MARRLPVWLALPFLLAVVPRAATAQDFSAQVSPQPLRLLAGGSARPLTIRTNPTIDWVDPITYGFSGLPSGVTSGGPVLVEEPFAPVDVPFTAGPNARPGTYTVTLTGTSVLTTHDVPVTLVVEGPGFTLTAAPGSVSLAPGGSQEVSVSAAPVNGFDGMVTVLAPSLAGVGIDPASFSVPAGGSTTVTVAVLTGAMPGPILGAFVGTAPGVPGKMTAPFRVEITAPPAPPPPTEDFALAVSPTTLALEPGATAAVTVSATGSGGITSPIQVAAMPVPGIQVDPGAFALAAGSSRSVTITVDPTAASGSRSLVFNGTFPAVGTRSTTATIVVGVAGGPVIRSITPPAVVTGTSGNVLRVVGEGFQNGATFASRTPGIEVTGAQILGPGAARIVVSVRPGTAAGPARLDLVNPDGGVATGATTLLVHSAGSLGAPLAVTAMAIVTPRGWQMLEPDHRVHAQALLATSGMGTVVGTWLLDGVPFDRFTRIVSGGFPVEVKSAIPIPLSFTGEHRLELAIESPASLPPREVPFFQVLESRSALRVLSPSPDEALDPEEPLFRWTLVPGATGYEIDVQDAPDGEGERPWTAVRRRVTDTEWRPEESLLRMLGTGVKRFRVRAVYAGEVHGEPTIWLDFTIPSLGEPGESPDPTSRIESGAPFRLVSTWPGPPRRPSGPTSPSAQGEGSEGELALSLMSTTSTIASDLEDPPPLTRLQLSTHTDLRGPLFGQQATADLSGSHDIEDPWDAREESRAWLTRFGATQGGFRQEATLGFAPPSFFDQTEFLTVATSGGGLQGTFGSPLGSVSYYRSVDLSANGGFAAFEPEIDAAAYHASDAAGRFLFRTMFLQVTDPEQEGFSPGGDGKALGVIGVAQLGSHLRILAEAAGGEFDPAEGSFEEARDGNAFRLSLDGSTGNLGYAFVLGRTGEGFVNPANRGFTPGGVSDRTRAEMSLQKLLGAASLSGRYSHVRGGIPEAAGDPGMTENGAGVQLAVPLHPRISLTTGANLTAQRGDAFDELGLPETHRTQKGLDLAFSESFGPVNLAQSLTWQDFADRTQPLSDQTVTGLNLTAGGNVGGHLALSGNVARTWTEAAPEIGTTRQLLVSLQPALHLAQAWLALAPRAAWTRVSNDLQDSGFRTDQYQVVVRWSPPWAGALLNLEAASDWNRSWTDLDPGPPDFQRQTVLTLTLNWRFDRAWGPGSPASVADPAQVAWLDRRRTEGFP